MTLIYKVASRAAFDAALAAGRFIGMPVDLGDGFIHFSTAAQLRETLRRHFAGKADLMLFTVEAEPLGPALRWEPSRGGDLFPHLYAELEMSAVLRQAPIAVAADGAVELPQWAAA